MLWVTIIVLSTTIFPESQNVINNNYSESIAKDTNIIYATMTEIPPEPSEEILRISNVEKVLDGVGDPPSFFSWRDYNGDDYTTPAKYQGSCGSCWAFSTTGIIEAKINIESADPDLDIDLSEQYILSCLPSAGNCNGGNIPWALYYIQDESYKGNYVNGIITEDCMPYIGSTSIACSSKCNNWMEKLWKIEDYGTSLGNIESIKNTLIDKGPVGTYMYSTPGFKTWGNIHHSPDDYYEFSGTYYSYNHAIIIVGFKDDPSIGNGGYWICKNSWGTGWGYQGFFNIEYGALNTGSKIFWVDVLLDGSLNVNFNYNPSEVTTNSSVHFLGIANEEIETWWWDFGDGYFSNLKNPYHDFYKEGSYVVKLTATTSTGETDYTQKIVVVTEPVIVADFTYNPVDPAIGQIIQFTDQSIGSNIVVRNWDFGDGSTSTIENPTHVYTNDGTYQVTLTISSGQYTDSTFRYIQVSSGAPTANFLFNVNGNQVEFTDTSNDPDGFIVSWEWNFGDGSNSNLQNPIHTYENSDTFLISLTVTDNNGNQNQISKSVFIDYGISSHFTYVPTHPRINENIQFSDASNNAVSWLWSFGDGTTSTEENPTHVYTSEGLFSVSLTVTNPDGLSDTTSQDIYVYPPNAAPIVMFSYLPENPTTVSNIQFTDASVDTDGSIVSWYWDFGDGTSSNLQNPIHKYIAEGNYDVTLTVQDDEGQTGEFTVTISVIVPTIAEILDQLQESYNNYLKIYSAYLGAQSFVPSIDSLTKISLYISRYGNPVDLTISIKSILSGSDLVTITIPSNQIPTSFGWVEIEFSEISVVPGETYYIVLNADSYSWSSYYMWGYSVYDTYLNGYFYKSRNQGRDWQSYIAQDFCFRTFGNTEI